MTNPLDFDLNGLLGRAGNAAASAKSPLIPSPAPGNASAFAAALQAAAGGQTADAGALGAALGASELSLEGKINASGAAALAPADMTMEEYKQYVHDRISALPVHPTQTNGQYAIHVSDAAFAAMKADPEYEKWVLDAIATNFATNDPWSSVCGGSYSVLNIGATKEESNGYGWYAGYQGGKGGEIWQDLNQGSFWSTREDKARAAEGADRAAATKRDLAKRWREEALDQKMLHANYWSGTGLFGGKSGDDLTDLLMQLANDKVFGLFGLYGADTGDLFGL